MKLKINKNIKLGLTIIIVISTIIFAYFIYNEVYNPGYEEQITTEYSYSNKGSINYSVYLKPNNLYLYNRLEDGMIYFTEYVDYVNTNLKYQFTGEREADIKGEYSIVAKVQGYTGEGDKTINIWEKSFQIIPKKVFESNNGKVSINENLKLNLNEYNSFVKKIKDETKINCQAILILLMNIKLTGTTDKGSIEESVSPDLVIPLDVTMFEISGNNIIDKPGAIEEIIQVQLPANKNLLIIYGIILAFLVIALIILILFIQTAPAKGAMEKTIDKIFKKHGDRLVALSSNLIIDDPIEVNSIEDLVKISDEAGRPILYKYSDDYKEIDKFFVSVEDNFFEFRLKLTESIEKTEKTEDASIDSLNVHIKTESLLN